MSWALYYNCLCFSNVQYRLLGHQFMLSPSGTKLIILHLLMLALAARFWRWQRDHLCLGCGFSFHRFTLIGSTLLWDVPLVKILMIQPSPLISVKELMYLFCIPLFSATLQESVGYFQTSVINSTTKILTFFPKPLYSRHSVINSLLLLKNKICKQWCTYSAVI